MANFQRKRCHAGILVLSSMFGLMSAIDPSRVNGADDWYLAVGHGGQRMLSRDGLSWEKHVSWGKPGHDQNDLNVAVNFKGAFFAGGGYFSGRMTATRDGVEWSDGVIPQSSPIFGLEAFGDTLYAVDLRGVVFKTTDGEKWELVARSEMPTKTHWIRAAVQGNGLIVASGDFGPAIVFDPATNKIVVTQMDGQVDKQPGLKRVAFGNGVFVCGGQDGLLAVSKDGKTWQNNKTNAERGDISCVEFIGKEFLATTRKVDSTTKKESRMTLRSVDGATWSPVKEMAPSQVRLINGWLYGYGWPRSKFSRSKDGLTWEAVPNEKEWEGKSFAFGPLAGGPPPKLPVPPKAKK